MYNKKVILLLCFFLLNNLLAVEKVQQKNTTMTEADIKRETPDCYSVIAGDWLKTNNFSSIEVQEINQINELIFTCIAGKIDGAAGVAYGYVPTEVWEATNEETHKFLKVIHKYYEDNKKLPPKYEKTLELLVERWQSEENANSDYANLNICCAYSVLAMSYIIDKKYEKAEKLWKEFRAKSYYSENDKLVERASEVVSDKEIMYYETKYSNLRLKSKQFKGSNVRLTITVKEIMPYEDFTCIVGYIGKYSKEELQKALYSGDPKVVVIKVPLSILDKINNLEEGYIIKVTGKAAGLSELSIVGNVPLVKATKIENIN